ncbi:MAG: CHASE2 domain-containing protein [Polymorphobacter sp.]
MRLARVRLAGVAAAVLTVAVLAAFVGPLFAERLFDRYQRWQPHIISNSRVHVVRIDAESLRALGPWPWPRTYLAALTDRLREQGAAAIGFDMIFAEPDPASEPGRLADVFNGLSPPARAEIDAMESLDLRFGRSIGLAPAVVARSAVTRGNVESAGLTEADAKDLPQEVRFTAPLPRQVPAFPLATANVFEIEDTARGHGLINGEPDADGVTRRLPMVASIAGHATPTMALELVRVAERRVSVTPELARGELQALRLGNHRIPVDSHGVARLHFGAFAGDGETSAVNILRQPRKPWAFHGKIVLIGPESVALGDIRTNPLGRKEFGVRIHAQAVDAILSGHWLVRPRWAPAAEWALGGLLAALAILGLPRLRRRWLLIVPAAVIAVVAAVSWLAFAQAQLLLDPLRPLLIGGSTGLAVMAMLFAETGRMARTLRESKLAQDGEMNAARKIQRAMLPDAAVLGALHPRLDLAALLEPAQEIGGDLYDGFALPDGRIVFLVGDVTGKGPSAALFMAVSKALAHSLLRRGGAPLNDIIGALNDELAEDGHMFIEVTMLCGIIDMASGTVELVNAGHENPLLLRADGTLEDVAMEGGLPLCTIAGFPYPLETLQLRPGDGLVIITDGVREAQNGSGDFFGSGRTRDVLLAWPPEAPATMVTDALMRAVRGFEAGTPASDDLTVMALRYRG